jgi:hypothetical protein
MPPSLNGFKPPDRWPRPRPFWSGVAVLAALAALGAVFAWYLSPHFVVDMATRLWSCI